MPHLYRFPGFLLSVVVAAAATACGGGSGGSGGGDQPAPVPEGVQVLLQDGATLPGGFLVETIESAKLAADRSVALIASKSGIDPENGVFVRASDGQVRAVLTPNVGDSGGLPLTVVRNLLMASTGEVGFEVGDQLDADSFYVFDGEVLHQVAHTAEGGTPAGFRVLGEARLGAGGTVAFSQGASPCEIDQSTGTERITCALSIQTGEPLVIAPVQVPNTLAVQKPNSILLQVNAGQAFAVGLPARGVDPFVGLLSAGHFTALLTRHQVIPELGMVLSAKPRAISNSEAIAVDATFDSTGDEERDSTKVLLLEAAGGIQVVAEDGGSFEGTSITDLRARDIDDANRVLLSFAFGDAAERTAIQLWRDGSLAPVAHEGLPFGEDEQGKVVRILEIDQMRIVSSTGDVIFVALVGRVEEGTRRISYSALMRWRDGDLEKIVQTKTSIPGGTLVGFSIADINPAGDILLMGEIDRRANRALVLLPAD